MPGASSASPALSELPLAELRQKATLNVDSNKYSAKSWVGNARKSAQDAELADAEGRQEDAFVKYLKACGFFELFLGHADYPKIKDEGSKHTLWHDYISFSQKRSKYLTRAKELSAQLKTRDVEQKQSASSPQSPDLPPLRPPTGQSSAEPDTSAGGSIAARMAALRGAGMQVQTSVKRISKDLGGPGSKQYSPAQVVPLPETDQQALPPPQEPTASQKPRSDSILSHTTDRPPSQTGSVQSPKTQPDAQPLRVRANDTGSSLNSVHTGNALRQNALSDSHTYAPPPPPSATSPVPPQPPSFIPSHQPKASLPNMPTSSYQLPDTGPAKSSPASPSSIQSRSRQNTISSNTSRKSLDPPPVPSHPVAASAPTAAADNDDDEITQFSSHFPSLDELEEKSGFHVPVNSSSPSATSSPRLNGGNRTPLSRYDSRPDTIQESEENGATGLPHFPAAPTYKPGMQGHQASEVAEQSTSRLRQSHPSTLSIPELPPRPSSLPDAETSMTRPTPSPKPPAQAVTDSIPSQTQLTKTTLPYTNSIMPATLRQYLQDPSLKILLIDTRSFEEHKKGWIGQEPDSYTDKNDAVWVDPTILQREGLDSQKLESALSLQPSSEQKAFQRRKDFDLVVLYDTASRSFPSKGSFPTAPAALFSIIFEKEFRSAKTLARSPVLLVGGYEAYQEELRTNTNANSSKHVRDGSSSYNQLSKGPPPALPAKKPTLSNPPGGAPDYSRTARRDTGVYRSSAYSRDITENFAGGYPQSMAGSSTNGSGYHTGHTLVSQPVQASSSRHPSVYSSSPEGGPRLPPPVSSSMSPGPLTRRRSDYIEHHNQPYSGYIDRSSPSLRTTGGGEQVTYPNLSQPQVPPPAASAGGQRQEPPRPPAQNRSNSSISFDELSKLPNQDDMLYWSDVTLGISGLKNLGNTCYMNSTLQCLSATYPLARFFRDGSFKRAINVNNPLGTKGDLAKAFSVLVSMLWQENYTFLSPVTFRKSISTFAPTFAGTEQHDSQEFLSFLLDGLHEDLNRVQTRPPAVEMTPEREAALETLPPAVAAEKEWKIYKQRNDSFVVDLFQGQYRNRLECLVCHKTSTTYDSFMYLSLPLPNQSSKISIYELIDQFTKPEILDGEDAWNCPRCKKPRRATKTLSIARLPPVLLIHLKRFTARRGGLFFDKSETPVIFPATTETPLDLTRWMPQSSGSSSSESTQSGYPAEPTSMRGPYRYDLFAVSNHMGNLSNGHYTAFVKSSKGAGDKNWLYCDDSKVTQHTVNDVVARPDRAYILFYKRVQH